MSKPRKRPINAPARARAALALARELAQDSGTGARRVWCFSCWRYVTLPHAECAGGLRRKR